MFFFFLITYLAKPIRAGQPQVAMPAGNRLNITGQGSPSVTSGSGPTIVRPVAHPLKSQQQ